MVLLLCPINKKLHKADIHKGISLLIKTIIALVACIFIYQNVFFRKDIKEIQESIVDVYQTTGILVLVVIFFLAFVNWGIETYKWRLLVKNIEQISFFDSAKAILCGITVSILSPNRSGEFGGRVFMLTKKNRVNGIFSVIVGGASQLLVTFIMGSIAVLFFIPKYTSFLNTTNNWLYSLLLFLIVSLNILFVLIYFNVISLTKLLSKNTFFERHLKNFNLSFLRYNKQMLLKTVALSFARYLVFSFQFYLLLIMFHVEIDFQEAIIMIALTFFAISIIPTIALSEIGVRGSAAIVFIGILSSNTIGIICSSLLLWIINIAIPAIIGIPFVFKLRFFAKDY